MKRLTSLLLSVATLVTFIFPLNGCVSTTEDTALSMGQWLMLIADSFGMENYVEEEPYFEKVTKSDSAFYAFQMAAEWDILKPSDTISSSSPVKWNDVLISLVNAGEFLSYEATDDEKIEFAIENFDSSIRKYWGNRYIKMKEAIPLLDTAQQMWTEKVFLEKIETATFNDNVVDNVNNTDMEYLTDGNIVIASTSDLANLKVGDVYTLPSNSNNSASINKVKNIKYNGDKVIITNEDDFSEDEVLEYIDEIRIQETSSPNFLNVTGIYDQYGNPIVVDTSDSSIDQMNTQVDSLLPTPLDMSNKSLLMNTGIFDGIKGTLKFKVKGYSIGLTLTKDDVSVQLSKELESRSASNRYREQKTKIYGKVKFEDVVLTKDVDYSWGKLHSATVKVDYKTVIEAGINTERSTEIGNPVKDDQETTKSISSVINQYKDALATLKNEVRNTKNHDDDIYICRLSILDGGLGSVDFIIKGKVSAEGDIKLTFEIEGAQGIQYKNNKLRYIKSKDVDCDFIAEGTLKVTIAPGFAITILNKFALIEIVLDAGLGASVGMTAHVFDIEGHELYSGNAQLDFESAEDLSNEKMYTTSEEIKTFAENAGGTWRSYEEGVSVALVKGICFEWKLYPILEIGIDGTSLVGKLAKKLGVSVTLTVLGSKNTILDGHIDFPNNLSDVIKSDSIGKGLSALLGINAECSYDYKPWDDVVEKIEELDSETNESTISISDNINLSTIRVFLNVGETEQIQVTGLPKGYSLSDIEVIITDEEIASFDINKGLITAKKETGTTELIVKTKDGKFKASCAITVATDKKVDFEELSGIEI